MIGNNMFAYCLNNPVNLEDPTGNLPQWIEGAVKWIDENIIEPIKEAVEDITEDLNNYDNNNTSCEVVFSSNYFSCYKNTFVVKTPFDASFSFGFIGLSTKQQSSNVLLHEFGHTVQMENMGVANYIIDVAIPSITINILDRQGKLVYDYYSYPWEMEANNFGGSSLSQSWKPALPEGGYTSYWDLLEMFFE